MPRSATARTYRKGIFHFLRNWQIVFQSTCTILHSHSQCDSFLASLSVFGVVTAFYFCLSNRYPVIFHCGFIGISLRANDAEYLSCLFAVSISSLIKCLFMPFAIFWLNCLLFFLLSSETSLYILDTSPLVVLWLEDVFSQSAAYLFILLHLVFHKQSF